MSASIVCPECGDRVALTDGVGPVGARTWTCRNGHSFGARTGGPPPDPQMPVRRRRPNCPKDVR